MEPHYPPHFEKGSLIELASGQLKRVEDMRTEDFMHSANISNEIQIDSSVIMKMSPVLDRGTVELTFCVGEQKIEVSVESTVEHPFFVFERGWSSYDPEKTMQRYQLTCHPLRVGDKIVSLTQKELKLSLVNNKTSGTNALRDNTSKSSSVSTLPR